MGTYVALYPRQATGPKLLLQRVTELKTTKNRMHSTSRHQTSSAKPIESIGLGARQVNSGTSSEHGSMWIAMADPDGNEFCICDNGSTEPWVSRCTVDVARIGTTSRETLCDGLLQ